MTISEKLKGTLKSTGVKQYILAEKCGFNPKTFSSIVNGKRKVTVDDAIKICDGLSITPNELLGTMEQPTA